MNRSTSWGMLILTSACALAIFGVLAVGLLPAYAISTVGATDPTGKSQAIVLWGGLRWLNIGLNAALTGLIAPMLAWALRAFMVDARDALPWSQASRAKRRAIRTAEQATERR